MKYTLSVILFFGGSIFCMVSAQSDSITIIQLQKEIQELQEKTAGVNWGQILSLGGISAVLFLLIGAYFRKTIEAGLQVDLQKYKSRLEEKVSDIEAEVLSTLNERKDVFDLTFEKTNQEQILLKNKRIYLWGETDDTIVRRVLKNIDYNFKNFKTTEVEAKEGYDLLIINNPNGSLSEKAMLDLVYSIPSNSLVFYYNNSRKLFPTEKLKSGWEDKVNFATNPSQIYGNLLNTLKYQDRIQSKSKST